MKPAGNYVLQNNEKRKNILPAAKPIQLIFSRVLVFIMCSPLTQYFLFVNKINIVHAS